MLNVLHVITGLGTGGAERMLARIATYPYPSHEVRQSVISLTDGGEQADVLRAAGVSVTSLGMRRGIPSPAAVWRLVGLIRRERPDAIMTWLYHADLIGTLAATLASRQGIVWNIRCSEFDLSLFGWSTRATLRMLVRLSSSPRAVAANSAAGRRAHEAAGYHPRRWIILPNGFDLDVWRPDPVARADVRRELDARPQDILCGVVARVDPLKGYDTVLAAAASARLDGVPVHFVLVGKGTETLRLTTASGVRVTALGERRDVSRLMCGFDMLVLSSISEGFPNVVGEAMATGIPCVVTDVGDAATMVGETGIVVPPREPEALAAAIATMAGESPESRVRRGADARERVRARWSLESVARKYHSLWQCVASGEWPDHEPD